MKTLAIEDHAGLSAKELASMARGEAVVLTHKGKPLVGISDLRKADWESIALANNPQFMAIIERSRERYRKEGGISLEEARRRLGLPPAKTQSVKGKRKKDRSASK